MVQPDLQLSKRFEKRVVAAPQCPCTDPVHGFLSPRRLGAMPDDLYLPGQRLVTQIDRTSDESSDICFRAASRPSPGGARRQRAPKQQLGRSAALGLKLLQARIFVGRIPPSLSN